MVRFVNRRSGKTIDVPAASQKQGEPLIQWTDSGSPNQLWRITSVDGAAIIQWPANGATNQQWTITDAGGGYVKLVSVRSGKVIGVAGNSLDNLAAIVQQTDTGNISQHWRMLARR